MLVLSRRPQERVQVRIGDTTVWVTVIELQGNKVRLGFEAPKDVAFSREELLPDAQKHSYKPPISSLSNAEVREAVLGDPFWDAMQRHEEST